MIKRIFTSLSTALLVFTLVGCGNTGESSAPSMAGGDMLALTAFGIREDELDTLAKNARETMGGLSGTDPCELTHDQCVAIYQKSYR